ncbi:MAG: YceI family protein [Bacteroidia bacterium]
MKKLFILFSPFLLAFAMTGIQHWKVGKGFEVAFSSPDIKGTFKTMTAILNFDEKDLEHSLFDVKVQANSLESVNPAMDDAAKGADMLNTAKYPEIHFLSSKVINKDTSFVAAGTLEMHGVKKNLSIPFSFRNHVFKGGFRIACSDYGMKGTGKGASDTVQIMLNVPVTE